jgi:hypothetical protein
MKIAIVGSREYPDMDQVRAFVQSLSIYDTVVSGGARGVDKVAEEEAIKRNMRTAIFKAKWQEFGKRAGYLRNEEIVAACDKVVAFWDGKSKGTAHTINIARKAGKVVDIKTPRQSLGYFVGGQDGN